MLTREQRAELRRHMENVVRLGAEHFGGGALAHACDMAARWFVAALDDLDEMERGVNSGDFPPAT